MFTRFTGSVLAQALWWFGLTMAVFGVTTELSSQQLFLSSGFYLELAGVSFLAGLYKLWEDRR